MSYATLARELYAIADALALLDGDDPAAEPVFSARVDLSCHPFQSDDVKRQWVDRIALALGALGASPEYQLMNDGTTVHYRSEAGDRWSGVGVDASVTIKEPSADLIAELQAREEAAR